MEQIKQLREITGAGMVDCKKALDEAGGDLDKAVEILRKKGIAKSAKRGDRETNEGVVKVLVNNNNTEGYVLEINSETDFVARNEKFQELGDKILVVISEKKPQNLEELLALALDGNTVKEQVDNLSGVIGEKLAIKRFAILSGETVSAYSHLGGKIGVLVALDQTDKKQLAEDIAMHVAAANPKYITPEEVPSEEIEKEKDIYREQLAKEGKTGDMVEKIMGGKVAKYYEDICLIKQEYVKEDKKKVEEVLGGAKVKQFIRFSL